MAIPTKEENWHIKRCADVCTGTGIAFGDGEEIMTRLLFENGEYLREDYSLACWEKQNPDHGLSAWKSLFHKPVPPEEVVKKENAESLLRKLVAKEDREHTHAIYILAVMLERKKILVEKEVQRREDQKKIRIYEHKKVGDTFLIVDPELKLAEIESVQEEVIGLLGGKPPKTETVYQFETFVNRWLKKHHKLLFPRRPVDGEEGITQKLAASFFSLLAGKKHEKYGVSEKILNRYEPSEQWGSRVKTYRELSDRIPQEIRALGLEKPNWAQQIRELSTKEPQEFVPADIQAAFADPGLSSDLRKKVEAALCAATAYAKRECQ